MIKWSLGYKRILFLIFHPINKRTIGIFSSSNELLLHLPFVIAVILSLLKFIWLLHIHFSFFWCMKWSNCSKYSTASNWDLQGNLSVRYLRYVFQCTSIFTTHVFYACKFSDFASIHTYQLKAITNNGFCEISKPLTFFDELKYPFFYRFVMPLELRSSARSSTTYRGKTRWHQFSIPFHHYFAGWIARIVSVLV